MSDAIAAESCAAEPADHAASRDECRSLLDRARAGLIVFARVTRAAHALIVLSVDCAARREGQCHGRAVPQRAEIDRFDLAQVLSPGLTRGDSERAQDS